MIAIADSGSTKADWKILDDSGERLSYSTMGFNPNYHSKEMIVETLKRDMLPKVVGMVIHKIKFYGAGCWDYGRKKHIQDAIMQIFPDSEVEIEHDLLAAARATCGNKAGIACILGTGSNSILYDGEIEVDNVTNLGFLIGDEGSGSHLGKKLIRAYFYRELPADLEKMFKNWIPGGKSEILDNVYNNKAPAVYLATFAKFLSNNRTHPFIENLVSRSFDEFITRHVCKYENYKKLPIHFVGSVAYYFQNVLSKVLEDKGLEMGIVIKKPIENLVKFHIERGDLAEVLTGC